MTSPEFSPEDIEQQTPDAVRARVLGRLAGQLPSEGLVAYRGMLEELGPERIAQRAQDLRELIRTAASS